MRKPQLSKKEKSVSIFSLYSYMFSLWALWLCLWSLITFQEFLNSSLIRLWHLLSTIRIFISSSLLFFQWCLHFWLVILQKDTNTNLRETSSNFSSFSLWWSLILAFSFTRLINKKINTRGILFKRCMKIAKFKEKIWWIFGLILS